jgi:hypothetical protein
MSSERQVYTKKAVLDKIKDFANSNPDRVMPAGWHIILTEGFLEQLGIDRDDYWLEFGVFSGATINRLSTLCDKVYGFDSFEGLPEDWIPNYPKGTFKVSELPSVAENVELVVGFFDESIPKFLKDHEVNKINFINIDCDLYSSTKTIFNYFVKNIRSGTYLYFDEFAISQASRDECDAFIEFINESGLEFDIIYTGAASGCFGILFQIK